MEGAAVSHSISGFSTRRDYQPDELFHAVEERAERYSHDYIQVFANAVAHGSIDGLLDFFKEGKGKALLQFRQHTKAEYKDKYFPELSNILADGVAIRLLTDSNYHAEYAADVIAMSIHKRLVMSDEKIRETYKTYCSAGHTNKLHHLDSIFGVDYSTKLNDIIH